MSYSTGEPQTPEMLYNLLPAIYRVRDAAEGEPLRALLAVVESEFELLKDDIAGLYDNWFVETCEEWVVPYIGDLLGVRGLRAGAPGGQFSQRGFVANTLGYRRRKGTVAVLEQLAHDITGWPAVAVEFFSRLITTQNANHVRLGNQATASLHDANRLELVPTPFDPLAHTAEVRHIDNRRGRFNIPHVGIFLWRLQPYVVERGSARPAGAPEQGRYSFHPLGLVQPLFNLPQPESEIGLLAAEINVPGPLRRRPLYDELQARRAALDAGSTPDSVYFGAAPVFCVFVDGKEVPAEEIQICYLGRWQRPLAEPHTRPAAHGGKDHYAVRAAVDPVLGRLVFAAGQAPGQVEVSYTYAFPGDLGGGPYGRLRGITAPPAEAWLAADTVADPLALDILIRVPADQSTLAGALAAWDSLGKPPAIIQVEDSHTYREDLDVLLAGRDLVIQAADEERPVLEGKITLNGGAGTGRLALDGLTIGGPLAVTGDPAALSLRHCTLVPAGPLGAASLVVEPPAGNLRLLLDHCISGALSLPSTMPGVALYDCIVAAASPTGSALVSGSLAAFPALGPQPPQLSVTLGGEGPYAVTLPAVPAGLEAARAGLEQALHAAGAGPAFHAARVLAISGPERLVILPGAAGKIEIGPTAADRLALSTGHGHVVHALAGSPPAGFRGFTAANPALAITLDGGAPVEKVLAAPAGGTTPLEQAASRLQETVRAIKATPAYQDATVVAYGDRLLVLPGAPDAVPLFGPAAADPITVAELALAGPPLALGSAEDFERRGPAAKLVRCTIFGAVRLAELELASESIFVDPVTVQRRQAGCARFSYLPPVSQTPQRFRCQPELAVTEALAARPGLPAAGQAALAQAVQTRVAPSFTAAAYGQPAFGQLSSGCPVEIRTGAEDGAEMGAFNMLKTALREANLAAALADYLRFGLEAGSFYVDYLATDGEGA